MTMAFRNLQDRYRRLPHLDSNQTSRVGRRSGGVLSGTSRVESGACSHGCRGTPTAQTRSPDPRAAQARLTSPDQVLRPSRQTSRSPADPSCSQVYSHPHCAHVDRHPQSSTRPAPRTHPSPLLSCASVPGSTRTALPHPPCPSRSHHSRPPYSPIQKTSPRPLSSGAGPRRTPTLGRWVDRYLCGVSLACLGQETGGRCSCPVQRARWAWQV